MLRHQRASTSNLNLKWIVWMGLGVAAFVSSSAKAQSNTATGEQALDSV